MKKKWAVVFLVVVCGMSGLIYEHHAQGSPSASLATASMMTHDESVEGQSLLCGMMSTLLFSSPRSLFEAEDEAALRRGRCYRPASAPSLQRFAMTWLERAFLPFA